MDYSELCRLKDRLLQEATKDLNPGSFASHEAYVQHIQGIEEGVLRFFTQSILILIETDDPAKAKKAS